MRERKCEQTVEAIEREKLEKETEAKYGKIVSKQNILKKKAKKNPKPTSKQERDRANLELTSSWHPRSALSTIKGEVLGFL